MLDKIIDAIMKRDAIKYNKDYAAQATADATQMYNAGWDALEDGTVVQTNGGNIVAVKNGNSVIVQEIDGHVNMGKLVGDVKEVLKTVDVTNKKDAFLGQAIVTKYYTVPQM
jgi:hypothetical protein